MKRVSHNAMLSAALLVCASADLARAQGVWTPIGPRSATVLSMARDPVNPMRLYAGAHFSGLHRSDDGGAAWTHIPTDFSGEGVVDIEIIPTTPSTIFVASLNTGVQRSGDGGATWENVGEGLTDPIIRDIAVDPFNPARLLAGSFSGVHVSEDWGQTWSLAEVEDAEFLPGVRLVFDPAEPDVAYAGSQGLGVFRSLDGGVTWTKFSQGVGNRDITSISFDPANPDALYAAATNGVFRLTRGQDSWEDLTYDLPAEARIAQLTFIAGEPGVFVATDAGVFQLADPPAPGAAATVDPTPTWTLWSERPTRLIFSDETGERIHLAGFFNTFVMTEDGGATMQDAAAGMQNAFIGALATVDAGAETILYAGAGADVQEARMAADPAGEPQWRSILEVGGAVFELAPHPHDPAVIYVGSEAGGVRKTVDAGAAWSDASEGIIPQDIIALDQDRDGQGSVYAASAAGVFVSFDEGATWEHKFQAQNPARITDVEADPILPDFAYYANDLGQIFRTENGGEIFTPQWRAPLGEHIVDLDAAPFAELYAVSTSGALYTSNDRGANFFRRGETDIKHFALSVLASELEPGIAYVGTVFGGVYKTDTSAEKWSRKSKGIDTPVIFSLAMHPADGEVVYAGAIGAVYRTDNGAKKWKRVSQDLPEQGIVAELAVDPHQPQRLFAWITGDQIEPYQRGVYRSLDEGRTWSRIDAGADFIAAGGLLVSRSTPGLLFAGAHEQGVFASTDAGVSWTKRSQGMSAITLGLAIDRANPDSLYAGTVSSGVFRSDDAGAEWASMGLHGVNIFNMAADPSDAGVVYAASALGAMRSLDAGQTWGVAGQKVPFAIDAAVDPADPGVVYIAGVGGGLYRSDDGGETWLPANGGLPLLDVQALTIDPVSGDLFAALERDGVYRSTNQGARWSKISLDELPYQFLDLEIDPASGDLYLATNLKGVFESRDGGATWKKRGKGLKADFVADIAIQPDARGRSTLFAAVLNDPDKRRKSRRVLAAVYRSTNGGKKWRPAADTLDEDGARALAVSSQAFGPIFAADRDGVHRSDNLGEDWRLIPAPFSMGVIHALALDESANLLYATSDEGVFVCDLATSAWERATLPPLAEDAQGADIAIDSSGGVFIAATNRGAVFSSDQGQTWRGGVDFNLALMVPHMVAVHPQNPDVLYAALQTQGVARSDDRGVTWRLINEGLDARRMFTITIDPASPDTIYATSNEAGVWVSDDAGQSWSPLNDGLFNPFVTAFAIDPVNPRILYAGTEGGGAFRLIRP